MEKKGIEAEGRAEAGTERDTAWTIRGLKRHDRDGGLDVV